MGGSYVRRSVLAAATVAVLSTFTTLQQPPMPSHRPITQEKTTIGIAHDRRSSCTQEQYLDLVARTASAFTAQGVQVDALETVSLDLPPGVPFSRLSSGVLRSFESVHDQYFIVTDCTPCSFAADDSLYLVDTPRRIVTLDPSTNLDTVVVGTIPSSDEQSDAAYSSSLRLGQSLSVFAKAAAQQMRTVPVQIYGHACSKEKAVSLIDDVNTIYAQFGLQFSLQSYTPLALTDTWSFAAFRDTLLQTKNTPPILLLTGRDWHAFAGSGCDISGDALVDDGYLWAEIHGDDGVANLCHELGHLFGAQHDYLQGSIMHPSSPGSTLRWTRAAQDAIIENRYRTFPTQHKNKPLISNK